MQRFPNLFLSTYLIQQFPLIDFILLLFDVQMSSSSAKTNDAGIESSFLGPKTPPSLPNFIKESKYKPPGDDPLPNITTSKYATQAARYGSSPYDYFRAVPAGADPLPPPQWFTKWLTESIYAFTAANTCALYLGLNDARNPSFKNPADVKNSKQRMAYFMSRSMVTRGMKWSLFATCLSATNIMIELYREKRDASNMAMALGTLAALVANPKGGGLKEFNLAGIRMGSGVHRTITTLVAGTAGALLGGSVGALSIALEDYARTLGLDIDPLLHNPQKAAQLQVADPGNEAQHQDQKQEQKQDQDQDQATTSKGAHRNYDLQEQAARSQMEKIIKSMEKSAKWAQAKAADSD